MKKCKHAQTDLILYLHGEMEAKQKEQFARHLKGCADCRKESVQVEHLGHFIQQEAAVTPPSPVFWQQYNVQLYRKLDERLKTPHAAFPWFGLTLVVALCFVVGLVFWDVFKPAVSPEKAIRTISQEEILNDLTTLEQADQSFDLEEILTADETKEYLLAEYELLEQVGALPDDFLNRSVSTVQPAS